MVDTVTDAARRNLLKHAMRISLVLRHGAALVVYTVVLISTHTANAAGAAFAILAGAWAFYRLVTRSVSPFILTIDYAVTIAACLAIPILVPDDHVCPSTCAPVAIGGTAIASFTVFPALLNTAMTAGVVAALWAGARPIEWWRDSGELYNLYYFALLWIASTLIRAMTVRVAEKVDAARAERLATELRQKVNVAVREYDREQLRLLHDTVASTLLMVGTGTGLSPDRVAAQARRDLEVFTATSRIAAPRTDVVAVLRDYAAHIATPVRYAGAKMMWLDGLTAATVAAAAREALTNVDRHSGATAVTISVHPGLIRIIDNGNGFDVTQPIRGHGIANSITARMRQLGGDAVVTAQPGHGTTVELRWPAYTSTLISATAAARRDPERLIERANTGYGLALIAYAVANLCVTAPNSLRAATYPHLQWVLIVLTVGATLSPVPRILGRRSVPARFGIAALMLVALVQSVSLPIDNLDPRIHWAEGTIGWCVLPLLLGQRSTVAAGVLIWCWTIPAVHTIIRDPSAHAVASLGYDTASILVTQFCALLMADVIQRAATAAAVETDARMRVAAATRIADAVQAEYQRRYANLASTIRPLLLVLAEGGTIDAATRRRAQLEYQRLRTLFDQSASFEHVLLRQLRPHIDAAQNRGIAVSVEVQGTLPALDEAIAHRLVRMLDLVLAASTNSARITITVDSTAVELSVIGHGLRHSELPTKSCVGNEDEFDLTTLDDTVWITVRHPLPEGPTHNARAHRPR